VVFFRDGRTSKSPALNGFLARPNKHTPACLFGPLEGAGLPPPMHRHERNVPRQHPATVFEMPHAKPREPTAPSPSQRRHGYLSNGHDLDHMAGVLDQRVRQPSAHRAERSFLELMTSGICELAPHPNHVGDFQRQCVARALFGESFDGSSRSMSNPLDSGRPRRS